MIRLWRICDRDSVLLSWGTDYDILPEDFFFFYYGKALLIVMHHIILANALDKLEVILEAGLLVYKDVSMIILIIHTYKMHCLMQ